MAAALADVLVLTDARKRTAILTLFCFLSLC